MAEGRRTTAGRARLRVLRPLMLLSALLLLGAAPAAAAPSEPALHPDIAEADEGPVVVVGIPGLMWSDVSPDTTPHLWGMAGEASIGNVSIRTATSRPCPTDGWLTVSAGQRAASERGQFGVCEPAPTPQSNGSGAFVPGFDTFAAENRDSGLAAPVGLLGQTVREAGGTTLAVGPGAALGAADGRGHVDHYLSDPADLTADRLDGVSLAAVELAELTRLHPDPAQASAVSAASEGSDPAEPDPDDVPEREREEALRIVDDRMRALLDVLPEGSALNVVGVSMDTGPSELTVGMSAGTTADGLDGDAGYLTSGSTRRPGLVALTDTTPSALAELGMQQTAPAGGRAWHTAERPETTGEAVDELEDFNTAAVVVGAAAPGFFTGLVAFQLFTYAAAAYALSRFSGRRPGERSKRALVFSVTRVAALAAAAFPVASYLANLIPWWASSAPLAALLVCVLAADALVVAVALLGPWRHSILGPMTVVAGSTAAVLLIDICLGANLQMNSPVVYSPLVCALVGFAANDSGVAVLAIALTVAVPLTLSACVWALQKREEETAGGSVPIADATRA